MATLDVVTLAEAKAAINFDGGSAANDQELALWVTAVSNRLDELCGAVVKRTVTDEPHDGGEPYLEPLWAPMSKTSTTTVTSVVEYDGTVEKTLSAETNTTKPADGYLFVRRRGRIYRRRAGSDARFPPGRENVLVTYDAGRYVDTASVGATFKLTAGAILRRLWSREQGAWAVGGNPFDPGAIGFFKAMSESMVREFLDDELRTPTVA